MSHYLAVFGGYWSSARGDKKYLICHVTSENHVIERLSNAWELFIVYQQLAKHRYCSSNSPSYKDWWPQTLWYWRYNAFSLSRALTRPRDKKVK